MFLKFGWLSSKLRHNKKLIKCNQRKQRILNNAKFKYNKTVLNMSFINVFW